jgi:ubiquitin-protein ligase
MAAKRIKFELEEKPEGMNFVYLNSNLGDVFNCVGYFIGPDNTPYEGCCFGEC